MNIGIFASANTQTNPFPGMPDYWG